MPRIDAATVAEHRLQVQGRLVDAAETLLRADPTAALTAGAVSSAAGIARNSIYRYVDTVDDLRTMVVNRYLPDWTASVVAAVEAAPSPSERVVAWVRANLAEASRSGHGWLMEAARTQGRRSVHAESDGAVARAHIDLAGSLSAAWSDLLGEEDAEQVAVAAALITGLASSCFRQLDAGQPADLVSRLGVRAAEGLVAALRAD